MLNDLRPELPEGCISDLTFDEWRAGELEPERIEQLEQHLETCRRCQRRHDAIEAQAERFLEQFPELELPSQPAAKPARVISLEHKRARYLAWGSGIAGLAAAAAAFALLLSSPHGSAPDAGYTTRTKGSSRIGFYVKHGDQVRRGGDGQVVQPGDQLRFSVTSNAPQHMAILSLDGANVASVYYPDGPSSVEVGAGRDRPLDKSVLLDDTLGEERLWGIFCPEPFALEPLRTMLARDGRLPELPRCTVDELSIVKEAPP